MVKGRAHAFKDGLIMVIGDDLVESKGTAGAGLGDGLIMFCRLEFE
jgi:hypothetical protein